MYHCLQNVSSFPFTQSGKCTRSGGRDDCKYQLNCPLSKMKTLAAVYIFCIFRFLWSFTFYFFLLKWSFQLSIESVIQDHSASFLLHNFLDVILKKYAKQNLFCLAYIFFSFFENHLYERFPSKPPPTPLGTAPFFGRFSRIIPKSDWTAYWCQRCKSIITKHTGAFGSKLYALQC